ncbi:MAG: two-component regulator propeller domain-containing protein, partial [Bacteroidota bacterium]
MPAYAQLQRNYSLYSVDNGLAQNSVGAIFQDHRGYLWFGTSDGMNRFDGYKMNYYKNNSKDPGSLSGIKGYGFYEDSQKRLWISHHKGVSIYNRVKDNFINLDLKAYNRQTMILREDKHNRVWLISGVTDLIAINTITLKLEKRITLADKMMTSMLPYYASSIRSFVVLGDVVIGYLNDNNIWFSFDLNTLKYKLIKGPQEFLGMFYAINDSTLCSFTRNYRYLYHVKSDRFTKQPYNGIKFTEYRMAGNTMAMWNGLLYIGNTTGLYIYDASSNTMVEHIQSFTKYEKKGFFYVQNLSVDKSNNLWISTNGDGVKCLSPYANKFKHYAGTEAKNRLVKAICTNKKGTIYTGLWGQDLLWYTADGKVVQHHFKKNSVEISSVLGLTQFDEEHVMLVNGKALKIIHPETGKVIFEKELNARKDIRGIGFPHFVKINKNKWLLSADRCIYEVNRNYKIRQLFEVNSRDTTIMTAEINPSDNNIWIGTNRGLLKYDQVTRKRTSLPVNEFIKSICIASNGLVYVGAEQGLFELDSKGTVLNIYSIGNKLVNDFIYGILEDDKGSIWFSHNKGLSSMNLKTKQVENYTTKDGIQSNEFNTGAYYKDENGLLYFGGVNGVNVINPDRIIKNTHVPKIAINEIMLGDVPYQSDTIYNEITRLSFDHTQNTLSFDFSALEFSQPEFNTYRYQLSGYDNKWIESGTKHFARYANLPPGKYIFKVKAANGDGVWNEDPRELYISISPPYWETGWFYLLVTIAGSAFLSAIVYVVVNRQKIKIKRELEIQQK